MSLLGWLTGADAAASAAKKAAKIQAETADENRALAEEYTGASLGDLDAALASALGETQAYADAGTNALSTLQSFLGLGSPEQAQTALTTLQNSPAYQFNLQQGYQALDRSRNAGGRLYSGGTLKAAQEYGQGFASNALSGLMDRVSGIADTGANMAGSRSNALLGTGQAKAGARSSGLNAITGANSEAGAATAGGVINAANAQTAGRKMLFDLAGTALGAFLGGQKVPA